MMRSIGKPFLLIFLDLRRNETSILRASICIITSPPEGDPDVLLHIHLILFDGFYLIFPFVQNKVIL
jgi:hypothetical protein